MHPGTGEIEIAGRTYSLVERTQGNHYEATLESDEGNVYTLRCHHGAWVCNCPAQKYRKRDEGDCKHIFSLRRRLEERLREQAEVALSEPKPAAALPPEQRPGEQARREYQEQRTMTATTEAPPRDAVNEARGLNSLSKPAAQQVTPAPATGTLSAASSQSGRTQFCIALAKAQSVVGRLAHDGAVAFGNTSYRYTTSEAVIEAAKAALGGNGLALVPIEETLNGHEKEGENRFELECKFILLHQSGEQLPLIRHWPVCPDRGRALDKATATASTLCLSYLLRDLLLIPRVNPEDDVNQRDDRPQQPAKQKPAKSAGKTSRPPPKDGAELEVRLKDFDAKCAAAKKCKPGELIEAIRRDADKNGYPPLMANWNEEQCRLAMEAAIYLARQMPAPAQARTES